jgi:AraC-like DNA-binding protein
LCAARRPIDDAAAMSEAPLPLSLFDAVLRGILLALLVLLAARLLRDRPRLPAAQAAAALCAGACVQVIGSMPIIELTLPLRWQAPLIAVSVANVVLFWVFVQGLFDDDFRFEPVHGIAWAAVLLLSGVNCLLAAEGRTAAAQVTGGLQRAVPLVFAVLAVMAAARHWRDDLVEERRHVRAFIVGMGVAYTVLMLVARLASERGRLSDVMALVDALLLLVIVAVAAWHFLRVSATDLFPSAAAALPPVTVAAHVASPSAASAAATPPPSDARVREAAPPEAADPADDRLAEALHRAMVDERAYRSDDLSIASLAARLAVPEYRLRRLINRRLGHRNFNAYVNSFRLADARNALADPQRRELPVLTIALEAGFQSIGPFNRAFKAATGLTPTEFRRENIAES